MYVTCTQENLSRALLATSRVVGTRGTLPVLGNILLAAQGGRIKVAATDLEMGITTWVGGKVEEEGGITVPARLFSDFITNNPDQHFELKTDRVTLNITSAHYKASIKGIDVSEFPIIPQLKGAPVGVVGAQLLKDAIGSVVFAAAMDDARPVLSGVLCQIKGKAFTLAATDSYRLSVREITLEKGTEAALVVPVRALQEVARLVSGTDEHVELFSGENQVIFKIGVTEVVSRVIEGAFPEYEQIIPKEHSTTILVKTGELNQAVKLAGLFAKDAAHNIRMQITENNVVIKAVSPHVGDNVARVGAAVSGKGLEVAFNANYITDALSILTTEEAELQLNNPLSPVVIRSKGDTRFLQLVMPLRLDEQP